MQIKVDGQRTVTTLAVLDICESKHGLRFSSSPEISGTILEQIGLLIWAIRNHAAIEIGGDRKT